MVSGEKVKNFIPDMPGYWMVTVLALSNNSLLCILNTVHFYNITSSPTVTVTASTIITSTTQRSTKILQKKFLHKREVFDLL